MIFNFDTDFDAITFVEQEQVVIAVITINEQTSCGWIL